MQRVVYAADCGITVNPDTVKQQIEGGIIFGLSAALFNEITIKDARVEQTNFNDYRMLRIDQAPVIEVYLVSSTEPPGGIGGATIRGWTAYNITSDTQSGIGAWSDDELACPTPVASLSRGCDWRPYRMRSTRSRKKSGASVSCAQLDRRSQSALGNEHRREVQVW